MHLSNNTDLPPLPAWKARSFWLVLLTGLSALLNALGVDLFAAFNEMGLGGDPHTFLDRVARGINALQELLPFFTGAWLWFERRAPEFRLVFWRKPAVSS